MNDYWTRYYKSLEGATIVKFNGMSDAGDYDEGFPSFTARLKDGSDIELEVSRDPEGNGGGFLFGLPLPQ